MDERLVDKMRDTPPANPLQVQAALPKPARDALFLGLKMTRSLLRTHRTEHMDKQLRAFQVLANAALGISA